MNGKVKISFYTTELHEAKTLTEFRKSTNQTIPFHREV